MPAARVTQAEIQRAIRAALINKEQAT